MNRDHVRQAFVDLIRPYVRVEDPDAITDSSLLVLDLNVNSTRFVDIILETEDKFKIQIGDEDIERFGRVGDAIDFICEKTAGV
jgi:acyl carrier protein